MAFRQLRAYRDQRPQSYPQTPADTFPSLPSVLLANENANRNSPSEDRDGRSKSGSSSGQSRTEASKKKHDALKLSKGQSRETTAKKGSRHADVIDRWDPTGLGHASEWF